MKAKRGLDFVHPTLFDPDWRPSYGQRYATDCPLAWCTVSRVTRTTVYYHYIDGSGRFSMDRAKFDALVEQCRWDHVPATAACWQMTACGCQVVR
jgi:hypothetical protein